MCDVLGGGGGGKRRNGRARLKIKVATLHGTLLQICMCVTYMASFLGRGAWDEANDPFTDF